MQRGYKRPGRPLRSRNRIKSSPSRRIFFRARGGFTAQRDGVPIAPHQLAARRAGTDANQLVVDVLRRAAIARAFIDLAPDSDIRHRKISCYVSKVSPLPTESATVPPAVKPKDCKSAIQ